MEEMYSTGDEVLAYALGTLVLAHMKDDEVLREAFKAAETRAMRILDEIREVLDDDTLEDDECCQEILKVLARNRLESLRLLREH